MSEQEPDSINQQKDVAYYSALLNAWIQTKMERDKTLASLSVGGIGLLVTILSTVGVRYPWQIGLYCGAFLSFALVLGTLIYIFDRNSRHIEEVINKKASQDLALKRYDKLSLCAFIAGAVFFMAIAVVTAVDKLDEKGGAKLSEEKKTENVTQQVSLKESLNGISNLSLKSEITTSFRDFSSFAGIANLRPQAVPSPKQSVSSEKVSITSNSQASSSESDSSEQSK